jgi:L-serine dehydratase
MQDCIERGLHTQGLLPGGLRVRRRAAELGDTLKQQGHLARTSAMDWVHVWAMAVNEENAAGGQVVTAPTNGAAGIVPAVLMYYHRHTSEPNRAPQRATEEFLLTATAVGMLFKRNASISGAEVGCQGEVGAAASMAAAGLTAVWGGTNAQIENAAEMAIEHSLGLTCDPIGGLVQVPCIERNGFGAAKAISAARLAMLGDGSHRVSLDRAIETMRQTGFDMSAKYKETAQGGLAVTYVEC